MTFLQLWLAASAVIVATFFLYHFAPIVLFLLALTAFLGAITYVIVQIAAIFDRNGRDPEA